MSEIEDLEKKLADLKRQRSKLESECPECDIKKTEDEDCPECRAAVGVGMYLNICKEIDSKKNCEDLFEKVDSGEITPEEFFDIIKEKAEDDPETLSILEYTDELIDSEGDGQIKKDIEHEISDEMLEKDIMVFEENRHEDPPEQKDDWEEAWEEAEEDVKEPVNPNPHRQPLRSDRQHFTRDGIPVVGHTWLYGDTRMGYSIKKGGSKPRYTPESYVWDNGFIVQRIDYEKERDARLYAYQDLKRRGWDLEPVSEEQADIEEEDIEVKVKPKKPVKPKVEPVEPVVKTKLVIEPETELSRLKKEEMKYYREEFDAKDYASKMEAYRKRLAISKKIKRLTRPPKREKPVLTRRQRQLEHEAKQIARIQKLDGRIEKQAQMDAELQVLKREYDPKEVDGKDPVLYGRQVEKHRTKLKDDISSLKQDENVSIADNKIKYDGEYMTYTHKLTEEEFEAIK